MSDQVDTIWFGVKVGIGIAVGVTVVSVLIGAFRALAVYYTHWRFYRAKFTWEHGQHIQGWISRDPQNDDWILWDCANNRMLRSQDFDGSWTATNETVTECLEMGRQYWRTIIGATM